MNPTIIEGGRRLSVSAVLTEYLEFGSLTRHLILRDIRLRYKHASLTVAEFKRLGDVSELERIYELQTGRVLEDGELIDTREAAYGSTADWERG